MNNKSKWTTRMSLQNINYIILYTYKVHYSIWNCLFADISSVCVPHGMNWWIINWTKSINLFYFLCLLFVVDGNCFPLRANQKYPKCKSMDILLHTFFTIYLASTTEHVRYLALNVARAQTKSNYGSTGIMGTYYLYL